jgi:hypothetical protein
MLSDGLAPAANAMGLEEWSLQIADDLKRRLQVLPCLGKKTQRGHPYIGIVDIYISSACVIIKHTSRLARAIHDFVRESQLSGVHLIYQIFVFAYFVYFQKFHLAKRKEIRLHSTLRTT